ncbi:uncharacterized protein LOC130542147 [Ursus arctos]|uniref:uncharacterized protein LOC130542147 n=1 Tax=Ursus arctos TaxID=9644 RepID=UPI002548E250|nr:uncharacterized protein LOC130542147 [Ursus arctos]
MGRAQPWGDVWCRHIWAWVPEAGYPRDGAESFLEAHSPIGDTPGDDKLLSLQLTVLGQRLVERPRADVDRDEDEEDQEEEEAGCRRGHSEELHSQRSLPPPGLAGCLEAPRCHGNRSGAPVEPSVYDARILQLRSRPHPRGGGTRFHPFPPPPAPVRESRNQTTAYRRENTRLIKIKATYQLVSPKPHARLYVLLAVKVWKLFLDSARSASPCSTPNDAMLGQDPESCWVCHRPAEAGLEVPDWTRQEFC